MSETPTVPDPRPRANLVIQGASEVLTSAGGPGDPVGRIPGGVVAIGEGRVLAVGSHVDVWSAVDLSAAAVIDAGWGVVAPGFIDAHTHLVFGGSRVREYAARLTRTRSEVAALGIPNGIMATVAMTRSEDADTLFAAAIPRLDEMLAHGTTTAESKSGYGLDPDAELKLLEVNRRLDEAHEVDLVRTFMGAHDFPADVPRDAYVDQVIDEMIPRVAEQGLARFCDVFCDEGYFSAEQARRILEAGRAAGLEPKIHADQYSDVGGADLAADLAVVSADHLQLHPAGGPAAHGAGGRGGGAHAPHRLRGGAPAADPGPRVDRGGA